MLMGRLDIWMTNQIRTPSLASHQKKLEVENYVNEELCKSKWRRRAVNKP